MLGGGRGAQGGKGAVRVEGAISLLFDWAGLLIKDKKQRGTGLCSSISSKAKVNGRDAVRQYLNDAVAVHRNVTAHHPSVRNLSLLRAVIGSPRQIKLEELLEVERVARHDDPRLGLRECPLHKCLNALAPTSLSNLGPRVHLRIEELVRVQTLERTTQARLDRPGARHAHRVDVPADLLEGREDENFLVFLNQPASEGEHGRAYMFVCECECERHRESMHACMCERARVR